GAVLAVARGPVGQPKVGVDRFAREAKLLPALDELQPLSAVVVIVELDRAALTGDDRGGLVLAPQRDERLGLRHARVGAERPVVAVHRTPDGDQGSWRDARAP